MSRSGHKGIRPDGFARFEDLARRLFKVKREKIASTAQSPAKKVSKHMPAAAKARRFRMNIDKKELRCSFCGKDKDHVQYLLAGPAVFICGECVDKCVEIIEGTKASGAAPA